MNLKRCFEKSDQYKVWIIMFLSYECFQYHNTAISELWKQNPRFWKSAGGRPAADLLKKAKKAKIQYSNYW